MFSRVIVIVLDACGVGELPDADRYGDKGASTIPNVARSQGGLNMPNCQKLGLGNIVDILGVPPAEKPLACYGKMAERSAGKDSTSGHWEIAGIITDKPFPVYSSGFPPELVAEFEKRAGVKTIGNIPASGTEIIARLGERHLQTGEIILYTSADSVFQLAAHEEVIPPARLYEICRIARDLLTGDHAVGRVIARPFTGTPGNFSRTANRKDFSLLPPHETLLDCLYKEQIPTVGIGKIGDLFAHQGLSNEVKTANNNDVMQALRDELEQTDNGLIFANLVDFDMLWGHRNDAVSFARGLEDFDRWLPDFIDNLDNDDLLIITADHGCDPTLTGSTDHTREYVPLLVFSPVMKTVCNLGTRESFSDIAATVAANFRLGNRFPGKSFLKDIVQSTL